MSTKSVDPKLEPCDGYFVCMDQIVRPLLISSGNAGALGGRLAARADATYLTQGDSIYLLGIVGCSDIISVSTIVEFHISKMEY